MALVAISMVAIIAIAALSIDVVTLFLAREEAQRSADAGALAAARVISLLGLTGDTNNSSGTWACICGGSGACSTTTTQGGYGFATLAAESAAGQSTISGAGGNTSSVFSVNVTYAAGGTSSSDCSTLSGTTASAFAVNPMVTVQVTRSALPTFFSRIWGNTGNIVSTTATAEAFNPSFSAAYANQGSAGIIIPVQPRCVKPWIVPNLDPLNPVTPGNTCTSLPNQTACNPFVRPTDGTIVHPGVSLDGSGSTGVIGENFTLMPDCNNHGGGSCQLHSGGKVQANYVNGSDYYVPSTPNLDYLPGQTNYSSVAVPAAAAGDLYEQAVAGCDQTTQYQCGVQSSAAANPNYVDLSRDPSQPFGSGDTMNGVMALIHETAPPALGQAQGQDYFNTYGQFTSAPFQILAGTSNPIVSARGNPVSASNSIVTVPIFDFTGPTQINNNGGTTAVTIVGFLQVFINGVDQYGNLDVTIMNVAGCSNGAAGNVSPNPVTGSSPVPVRLITAPPPPAP